jgi:molybdopterin-guanine dinucleotide biosynthesis protein A
VVDLAGVVLCGGAGRRMGGPKALLKIGGELLIERIARGLEDIASPVLIAPGDVALPALSVPYEHVRDAASGAGPLAGIVGSLRVTDKKLLAVVGGDMPYAQPSLLRFLAQSWAGEDAVIPIDERGSQPLHAIYSRAALPQLEESLVSGEWSVRSALERLNVRSVRADEWEDSVVSRRFAFNLNEPGDLEGLG